MSLLLISDALLSGDVGGAVLELHPELHFWPSALQRYRRQWFDCTDKNPLGWYATLCERSPAALLAGKCDRLPEETAQCWVASPYHGLPGRDSVRVMSEGQFPWSAEDALYLCNTLNPLLAEEGMQLFAIGAALLLSCRESIEAYPQAFGVISGQLLPDRHHEGADGGRLNRLLSEIQMLLFQHPSEERHARGEPDVSGLWFWSPVYELVQPHIKQIAVATRNPVLQSIVDGKNADVIITEAERLAELVKQGEPLPNRIVLAGENHAVLLTKSWLPTFGRGTWKPKSVREEVDLYRYLGNYLS